MADEPMSELGRDDDVMRRDTEASIYARADEQDREREALLRLRSSAASAIRSGATEPVADDPKPRGRGAAGTIDRLNRLIDRMSQRGDKYLRRALLAEQRAEDMKAAILAIDAHAVPFGEDEDGWTTMYLISCGPLHKALGVVGHSSAKCVECPAIERIAAVVTDYRKAG